MSNKRGIHPQHLHDHVIKPACIIVDGHYRPEVAQLMLGTAAQESHCGRFLQQLGRGPAHGIFQMEEPAFRDVWENYINYRHNLVIKLEAIFGNRAHKYSCITTDMLSAAVMCRLDYKREPQAIPGKNNITGHANNWKAYWNSKRGKGTTEEYLNNYETLVLSNNVRFQ